VLEKTAVYGVYKAKMVKKKFDLRANRSNLLSKACRKSSWSAWICSILGRFTEDITTPDDTCAPPFADLLVLLE